VAKRLREAQGVEGGWGLAVRETVRETRRCVCVFITGVLRKKKGFHDPSKKKPNCVPPKKVSGDSDIDPFFVDIGKFWKC